MKYDLVIIGVNYCTTGQTIEWVKSIREKNEGDAILIVVVDTSAEKTDEQLAALLKKEDPDIVYLNPRENLGYMGGARYGLNRMKEQEIRFDALIMANVDIRFEIEHMAGVIRGYDGENVGVLAPSIIADGKDLNPYKMERMTKAQQRRRILYLRFPLLQKPVDAIRRLHKQNEQAVTHPDGEKIYMGYGACFIFMARYFEKGGDLDLPLFLYGEEPYVSEMCLRHGLDVIYAPRIVIRDIGHVSTSTIPSRKHRRYLIESAKYCIKEFYH